MAAKPKLAVFKFASCDGCQLSLLDCEDELLTVGELVQIANFAEASSDMQPGPYDVTLVEGSVTTPHDRERILQVRRDSKVLITIGACATAGGIQALRNFAHVPEMSRLVYAHPEYLSTLDRSTPIADHVKVDFELRGCPVDKQQLLDVVVAFATGRTPRLPAHSVCLDCKRKGLVCVMVTAGTPCMGPITHTGCGALCPSFSRGCFGCFGPQERVNAASLESVWRQEGVDQDRVLRALRTYNSGKGAFAEAADAIAARAAEPAAGEEGGGP